MSPPLLRADTGRNTKETFLACPRPLGSGQACPLTHPVLEKPAHTAPEEEARRKPTATEGPRLRDTQRSAGADSPPNLPMKAEARLGAGTS